MTRHMRAGRKEIMVDQITKDEYILHAIYNEAYKLQLRYAGRGADALGDFDAAVEAIRKQYPYEFTDKITSVIKGVVIGALPAVPADRLKEAFMDVWKFHRELRDELVRAKDWDDIRLTYYTYGAAANEVRGKYKESPKRRAEVSNLLYAAMDETDDYTDALEDCLIDSLVSRDVFPIG